MIIALLLAAEPAVTWVKIEKPTFDLVGVVLGSFQLAGLLLLTALTLGLLGGAALLRSRRRPRPTPIESVSLQLDLLQGVLSRTSRTPPSATRD
jgi:hypothetical protein